MIYLEKCVTQLLWSEGQSSNLLIIFIIIKYFLKYWFEDCMKWIEIRYRDNFHIFKRKWYKDKINRKVVSINPHTSQLLCKEMIEKDWITVVMCGYLLNECDRAKLKTSPYIQ